MEPLVLDLKEEKNELTFTISNINVSFANAIRRVILSDIPTVVFRTIPYEKNDATFIINTSKFNNEILKQRLSCIPIFINDLEIQLENYIVEIDVYNDTENIQYVTTADFKIKNKNIEKYLTDEVRQQIFPPDPISKQYIDFCRLQPRLSDDIKGEHLKLNCKFSTGTSSENASFNVVSQCTYRQTPDLPKIEEELAIKEEEFREKYETDDEIEFFKKDWLNLDAKRITLPDSYDFTIKSIGVFDNLELIKKAILNIIKRLNNISTIYSQSNDLIKPSSTTLPNSFDIILENEDYTIGKILESVLYQTYYINDKSLDFCGFRKPHPHINSSTIRLAFKNTGDTHTVILYINNSVLIAIQYYEKLLKQFGLDENISGLSENILKNISYVKTTTTSEPQKSVSQSPVSLTSPLIQKTPIPTPATSAPGTYAPGTSAPGTSAPGTSAPGTSAPGTSAPGTAAPGTFAPGTSAPGTSAPPTPTPTPTPPIPAPIPTPTPSPPASGTSAPATPIPATPIPATPTPATPTPGTPTPGTPTPGTPTPGTPTPAQPTFTKVTSAKVTPASSDQPSFPILKPVIQKAANRKTQIPPHAQPTALLAAPPKEPTISTGSSSTQQQETPTSQNLTKTTSKATKKLTIL